MTQVNLLRRLIALDAALAGSGVRVSEFAAEWGVDPKTIRRDLDLLRDLGCEIPLGSVESGPSHVFRYTGKRRLFSKWAAQ